MLYTIAVTTDKHMTNVLHDMIIS